MAESTVSSQGKELEKTGEPAAGAAPPMPTPVRYQDLVERMERYIPRFDPEAIHRAYVYAAAKHRSQTRRSGEPYLSHPLHVAYILADMELEPTCVVVALLHDVVEDTATDLEEIERLFGRDVAHLVDGVTKLSKISFSSKEVQQAENFRKLVLAMVGDIRALLVKLADRLHNMQTLGALLPGVRERKARETLEIYAPLAYRLGMGRIKSELEELAFGVLNPREQELITANVEERRKVDTVFIRMIERTLQEALAKHRIAAAVEWRVKTTYSIYRKVTTKHVSLDEVYDYLAFRIITDAVGDEGVQACYRIMGILHGVWKHVPGRIKDFIAIPKPNNYRSLHTTLMTGEGHPFEVQIRTCEMHILSEEGIAAHWRYKEGKPPREGRDTEMFGWLRRTVEWLRDVKDPREFVDSMQLDLYPAEVYVFSPKGDVFSFPRTATPLDFAYRVHTEVGHRCIGAKVNGRMVPLDTPLRNGDVVEILTGKEAHPGKDWLKLVSTSRARVKIKAWFAREEKAHSVEMGREILEKHFRRRGFSLREALKDERKAEAVYRSLGVTEKESLCAAVAYGKVLPRKVLERFYPEETPTPKLARDAAEALPRTPLEVRGAEDLLINLTRCCHPIPGEDVIGYITRGRGVSVHRRSCPNVKTLLLAPERMVEVQWRGEDKAPKAGAQLYPARLVLHMDNRVGMLAKISVCIAERGMNIRDVKSIILPNGKFVLHLTVETLGLSHLKRVMEVLREVDGVFDVARK
ncbi:MAG: bifunctional (p)ppGpp synthetase/guanosine-3',5'-bis(diphosphate) 3'-pyrophosphohydrolase [Acidobacteriota bacterium]|nr:MAG: bifunctional (p)ppGpp synthetase/guanosine-3',5'-bis(diphosphate) 3'-pyrophosphohydrolase [Acidobacteriota bacterium]